MEYYDMEKYIRYEVIQNEFWSRPYMVGYWINDKGVKKEDWLLSFGSRLSCAQAKTELEKIAAIYNKELDEKNVQA